ncbi:phosphatase PAP2 family protein [Mangrovimonas spongiae]|uniref:Phosphatase PAP2 family protein n=1 Tax=Mangrovimonas spongiae TaxID=2494697 RepID=A0A428K2A1_9FLAO|nr:phosphatase PAP2 family protein [Mangrovimonas spongiae]RSK40541.1 phosphatase PAP2 family protein [Mangrovimonas spongiae]
MLEQILHLDTELFIYLNTLGTKSWDAFWMFYTTKFYWIPLYAVLLFFIFKEENKKMFLLTLVLIVAMVTFTDQITNVFKHGLMRPRPCHEEALQSLMRLVKPYCGGKYGYFSGHASNSMAVAVFSSLLLRRRFKNLIWIMVIWSIAMGYSRIYIGVHYPLDVLSGLTFGALSGFMFYKLNEYFKRRYNLV